MFADTKAYSGIAVKDIEKAHEFYDAIGCRAPPMSSQPKLPVLHLAGERDTLIYEQSWGSNPTPSAEAPWCYGSISFGSPNLGISPGSRKVVWSAISCPSSVSTLMLRGSKVSRSSFQR
jgi:hypothetical protein